MLLYQVGRTITGPHGIYFIYGQHISLGIPYIGVILVRAGVFLHRFFNPVSGGVVVIMHIYTVRIGGGALIDLHNLAVFIPLDAVQLFRTVIN